MPKICRLAITLEIILLTNTLLKMFTSLSFGIKFINRPKSIFLHFFFLLVLYLMFSTSLVTMYFHSVLDLLFLYISPNRLTISSSRSCGGLPRGCFWSAWIHLSSEPCDVSSPAKLLISILGHHSFLLQLCLLNNIPSIDLSDFFFKLN